MVDKSENILVEFDYNNISIIDPNKVIDSDGKVKERYVKQENLVMYANLECKVLPRTKLAIGVANNDQVQTVSIASINFLKPGDKTFLDNKPNFHDGDKFNRFIDTVYEMEEDKKKKEREERERLDFLARHLKI